MSTARYVPFSTEELSQHLQCLEQSQVLTRTLIRLSASYNQPDCILSVTAVNSLQKVLLTYVNDLIALESSTRGLLSGERTMLGTNFPMHFGLSPLTSTNAGSSNDTDTR